MGRLIDRELYLPQEWTDDPQRARGAHIPETVGFATKPRLAEQMITRILPDLPRPTGQTGRELIWAAADEVYGHDRAFRVFLEDHHLPYAVNVPVNQTVLARPGWRHIARLVERVAAALQSDPDPRRRPQATHEVGFEGVRAGGGSRRYRSTASRVAVRACSHVQLRAAM